MLAETETMGTEFESTMRLALIPGIGPRTRMVLLERFGTSAGVLTASAEALRQVPGVGGKLSRAIIQAQQEIDVASELRLCREHRIRPITPETADYPAGLRTIPDPPGVLFCRGELLPRDAIALAIVGTRHATQYGLRHAERLAEGLAHAGFTIVSGLARGIDAAAHWRFWEVGCCESTLPNTARWRNGSQSREPY